MIKKMLIKKLILKNGFYDRELLVELMQSKRFKSFIVKKFYKKFLRLEIEKPVEEIKPAPEINALERIGQAYPPINFLSKLRSKFL